MSQPQALLRVTGTVLSDKVVTIPARAAFTAASGKHYDAKPASSYREATILGPACYEGTYAESMQAVTSVKVPDDAPQLADGEAVDWYVTAFALTKPGVNGRSPYPTVALSFVVAIEAEAEATTTRRKAA